MKINHKQDYYVKRLHHYPSVGDQLDAIWAILADPKNKLDDTAGKAVADAVRSVKTRFPKP